MRNRHLVWSAFTACIFYSSLAAAVEPTFTDDLGQAIRGYDPVAYFTDGKPVEGKPEFSTPYQGAVWRFASAEHRDLFKADPAKYAPQYGGYCAYAVSHGKTAPIDPQAWKIVYGKLYLNKSSSIKKDWEEDIPGHIRRGDLNWPKILGQK
jgi:YHS domain-containing protein